MDEPLICQINPEFCFRLYHTKEIEVSKIVTNFANKHSSGADALGIVILKSTAPAITGTLVQLIKYSLITGVFLEQLAVAKVIASYEKGP